MKKLLLGLLLSTSCFAYGEKNDFLVTLDTATDSTKNTGGYRSATNYQGVSFTYERSLDAGLSVLFGASDGGGQTKQEAYRLLDITNNSSTSFQVGFRLKY